MKTAIPGIFYFSVFCLTVLAIIGMRILYAFAYIYIKPNFAVENVGATLIVGAGNAGRMLLEDLQLSKDKTYYPIYFADDDTNKINTIVSGTNVFGPTMLIPEICKKFDIKNIWIAIPSCSASKRDQLRSLCDDLGCDVKELPSVEKIIKNESMIKQSKKINIADLLGREEVLFGSKNVNELVNGKVCMVTGGGGSIGSELCRQIVKYGPKILVIIDIYENNAYDIQQELRRHSPWANVKIDIASVRDYDKMDMLFNKYKPQIVFHAAAHKHVPLMEYSPEEAVKNNIFGTYNVARLCEKYNAGKMILISTDKAVNPTNVMGATKRCCEMVMQYMAQQSTHDTEYAAVRFGNVLGSNGSVIPLFKKQIDEGGPVTVTHKDIIRYFMTIPEAVSLVLQAGAMATDSEIFVLDMGEAVKITTLAENIIKFYGYEPYTEMPIIFTGLRPGEKLFEELLMNEEGLQPTYSEKIFIGKQTEIDPTEFLSILDELWTVASANDSAEVINVLHKAVPTFKHS
ncbi:MAG: nucleoside-diphosphate sugar epimerase/dehydratase, partial [Oscillospiraceae bacterium]